MIGRIRRLFDHLEWADGRVLRSLRQASDLPDRALEMYGHVLGAEHIWLARILGTQPTVAVWPTMSLDEFENVARANHAAYTDFLGTLDDSALEQTVAYRNSAGAEFTSRIDDVLIHVALHGTYHRGQVALLLREADAVPEPTDYIAFVRGAPAATRTSSE